MTVELGPDAIIEGALVVEQLLESVQHGDELVEGVMLNAEVTPD